MMVAVAVILAIILIIFLVYGLVFNNQNITAEGYEDESGFHYGKPESRSKP